MLKPRPHQKLALKAIANHAGPRATVVMACGTGKTLVQSRAAKGYRTVVVLVPSLGLMRQTIESWNAEGMVFDHLCVCSDDDIAKGLDDVSAESLSVTTDPTTVSKFIRRRRVGMMVVFCTYQSVSNLAGHSFEIGLFDEAHKTTGGGTFGFALHDKNVRIKKRLFFTATPRVYAGKGDSASMDDESLYGPIIHRLSFAQAAAAGIIVPYKVIISCSKIHNKHLAGSKVEAQQLAMTHAVDDHRLQRIISFHSSVTAARQFSESPLPGFSMHHVHGSQGAEERAAQMEQFAQAKRALITNARCLTEGVDVPSVDMVAFVDPRRSHVDIAQAVGRAMRTSPGKNCGYVFVPVFLEEESGETVEQATKRANFDDVMQVLNAMRGVDEELAEVMRKAATGAAPAGALDRFVEVVGGEGLGFRDVDLRDAITSRVIDESRSEWDERYLELLAYREKHGHCNVMQKEGALGGWCCNQRKAFKRGDLSSERLTRLQELGFTLDPLASQWDDNYFDLVAFKRTLGHCNAHPKVRLGRWCGTQRQAFKHGDLSSERIDRLRAIGFEFDMFVAKWDTQYLKLQAFKRDHGHCNTYSLKVELREWCADQRAAFKRGDLSSERLTLLQELGFDLDPFASRWDVQYLKLQAFKKGHGHCRVSKTQPLLRQWCRNQRAAFERGDLSSERLTRLQELGFDLVPREKKTAPHPDHPPAVIPQPR